MRKPIIPVIVTTLRERLGLSQRELAERARISKDALSRLELGKIPGTAERTQTALAKVLNVTTAVLTGDEEIPPIPASVSEPRWDAPTDQWNIRVDSAVRNAFSLAELRYGIPIKRIIEAAPYLFVAAAERSLERRRIKLVAVEEACSRADAAAQAFPHLPCTLARNRAQSDDAILAEKKSIENCDLLAEQISNTLFMSHDPIMYDYDPDEHNPLVVSLREEAPNPDVGTITRFSRTNVESEVCRGEAMKLADGNADLAEGILEGWAPLHEMPRELRSGAAVRERLRAELMKLADGNADLAEGAVEGWAPSHEMPRELCSGAAVRARLEWLRSRASEHEAAMAIINNLTIEELMELK